MVGSPPEVARYLGCYVKEDDGILIRRTKRRSVDGISRRVDMMAGNGLSLNHLETLWFNVICIVMRLDWVLYSRWYRKHTETVTKETYNTESKKEQMEHV